MELYWYHRWIIALILIGVIGWRMRAGQDVNYVGPLASAEERMNAPSRLCGVWKSDRWEPLMSVSIYPLSMLSFGSNRDTSYWFGFRMRGNTLDLSNDGSSNPVDRFDPHHIVASIRIIKLTEDSLVLDGVPGANGVLRYYRESDIRLGKDGAIVRVD